MNTDHAAAFDPNRLRIARLAAGYRANQLADLVGVTASAISQYEHGYSRPTNSTLAQLAVSVGMPIQWFATKRPLGAVSETGAHFRSLRSSSKQERGRAFAHAVIAWDLCRVIEDRVQLPIRDIPVITPNRDADVYELDSIAHELRNRWGLSDGPIPNVVRLVERHGAIVLRSQLESRRVYAFSYDFGTRPIVMLGNDADDTVRSRFDAAHELGHLVMHPDADPGDGIVERQAHGFAAGLLMPAELIRPELPAKFVLSRYIELRHIWGVSVAALLYRARELGVMSEDTYRRAVTKLAVNGHRTNESAFGDLGPAEQPTLLARAVALLDQHGISPTELADLANISEDRLWAVVGTSDRRPAVIL